jgi:hypothetical protein
MTGMMLTQAASRFSTSCCAMSRANAWLGTLVKTSSADGMVGMGSLPERF